MASAHQRNIGIAIILAGLTALGVSVPRLVQVLGDRPDLVGKPTHWFGEPLGIGAFTFRDTPVQIDVIEPGETSINASTASALSTQNGDPDPPRVAPNTYALAVTITDAGQPQTWTFGPSPETKLDLIPSARAGQAPSITPFEEWFAIVPMVEVTDTRSTTQITERIAAGTLAPDLLVAARLPPENYDPESWARVRRKDWEYRFVRLSPDAPPGERIVVTSATYGELESRYFPGPYDDALPPEVAADPQQRWDGYWRHAAMLRVTPPVLYRAKDKQVEAGMRAMGWAWPTASIGMMSLAVGGLMIGMSRVESPVSPRRKPLGDASA